MWARSPAELDFQESWIEGDPSARWRTVVGHGPSVGAQASGSSLLEVDEGCRLPRHTDSAEETIVVTQGEAAVYVGDEQAEVGLGGAALVPEDVPHEVRNAGTGTLRFVAVYASTDVVTTYERAVEPAGERQRSPVQ